MVALHDAEDDADAAVLMLLDEGVGSFLSVQLSNTAFFSATVLVVRVQYHKLEWVGYIVVCFITR